MILVFGGTTEGRKAVQVIDKAGKTFYYSTKGDLQEVNSLHAIRLNGAMDAESMINFCKENEIRLLIDAAHPFAGQLHRTIADASEELQIPVIRYERIYPPRNTEITWCNDYPDAIEKLRKIKINRLLALTGVQTISKLKPFWLQTETWFRILKREESLSIAQKQGFPEDKLLFYQSENNDSGLIKELRPDAIILKESGTSGGFTEKAVAAFENNVKVFAVKHPAMPDDFYTVDGEHGLRRMIEQLLPGFYTLRTGITTGSCATAATVAALTTLLTGKELTNSRIILPDGEHISIPVSQTKIKEDGVSCAVIKDSGDDADVTNGISIVAEIQYYKLSGKSANEFFHHLPPSGYSSSCPRRGAQRAGWWEPNSNDIYLPDDQITITGGQGVGTVTLPGLGLPIGGPAINTGPQQMIRQNIRHILSALNIPPGDMQFEVCISAPGGEEIARRTFNPRLGVIGGISIIGTSGIVQPFSIEAFISSIRKSMEVARASLSPRVVINSGAKSEKYLRNYYSELPDAAFVHYGNYIGETLKIASNLKISHITLGIMIGKAVKLAEGHLDTHSKKITMNKPFLMQLARESGCCDETIYAMEHITLARELWTIIPKKDYAPFFGKIISLCYQYCVPLLPHSELTILLVNENGDIFEKSCQV